MSKRRERQFADGHGIVGKSLTSWTHRAATPAEAEPNPAVTQPRPFDGKPYLEDPDLTLYQGDVSEILAGLEAESVHCVVTSPPYWGLRDYGTGLWEGGNPDCDHRQAEGGTRNEGRNRAASGGTFHDSPVVAAALGISYGDVCGKCGARRVDSQLGLEPTPDLYLEAMVAVFREVRRVLRRDGTCWLNIGDSYNAATSAQRKPTTTAEHGYWESDAITARVNEPGLKPKDLCMIPARLALALQADGWWLRSQIVWSKPNPMPESVTDRPTSSYELVYLLAKSPRYFFDAEAVREAYRPSSLEREKYGHNNAYGSQFAGSPTDTRSGKVLAPGEINSKARKVLGEEGAGQPSLGAGTTSGSLPEYGVAVPSSPNTGRNVRNVWEIATQPYPEAHFATYPEELVRRCVLAGTSERGCCPECGAPWERQVEATGGTIGRSWHDHQEDDALGQRAENAAKGGNGYQRASTGWLPGCAHVLEPVACTVLDPFFGSGTTGLVARKHGRRTIGIELSPDYCQLAARRLQQLSLLA